MTPKFAVAGGGEGGCSLFSSVFDGSLEFEVVLPQLGFFSSSSRLSNCAIDVLEVAVDEDDGDCFAFLVTCSFVFGGGFVLEFESQRLRFLSEDGDIALKIWGGWFATYEI